MILSDRQEVDLAKVFLRDADAMECIAGGMTPRQALARSMETSDEYHAVYIDDELAAVWGFAYASLFSYRCQAWLLTTEAIEGHNLRFARSSSRVLQRLFERFEEVEVYAHAEYDKAMNWLVWLGFKREGACGKFLTMVAKRRDSRWVS